MLDNDFEKDLEAAFGEPTSPSLSERPEGTRNKLFTPSKFDNELEESLKEDEHEIRLNALVQSAVIENPHKSAQAQIEEKAEEYDEEDAENELRFIMENKTPVRELDLEKDLPSVGRETLNEYILMRGTYTTLSLEFIQNEDNVPTGTVPLAIWSDKEQKGLFIRNIQATPDVLYNMKYFLVGIDFLLVKDNQETELDICYFLGKIPLLEKEVTKDDVE